MSNKIEDKAFRWFLARRIGARGTIRRNTNHNPDFIIGDKGFEIKTCYGAKYFKHSRNEPGVIVMSSMKQWQELVNHPNCSILVFGEGQNPIATIPMIELPLGTPTWHDIKITVMSRRKKSPQVADA